MSALQHRDPTLLIDLPFTAVCADPLTDDDVQLALWTCYELHYRGFVDTDPTWEWQPELIAVRRELEGHLLDALHRDLNREHAVPASTEPVARRLRTLVDSDDGPSLSRYVQRDATAEQFREFVMHRSLYQLKEADPHTWAVPRLGGRSKAALIEIQIDEYGGGDPARMHSELYRTLLRSLGLDDTYGAYVNAVPGIALAISNVMSMFGLRRDLRGALVGHLAAYEMTSSEPCRRYARGLRRLEGDAAECEFYDEHVTADALHEQLAAHDLCGGLAADEPELAEDILFGAASSLYVDTRFAQHVLGSWQAGRTSLYEPATELVAAG
ncbi:iron-containing redox enzyme family protein [uncultured Jatrophihabitans sp.]|uniref:iron-containing redox enzyme family protein n=1 Tax=uncultured Jatrophihabitans sp. TaxID=1610747 RepID=UPI0035CBCD4F